MRRNQLRIIIALSLGAVIQFALLTSQGFTWEFALYDALFSWIIFLITSLTIFQIQMHYHAKRPINATHLGLILISTIFYQFLLNTSLQLLFGYETWKHLLLPYEVVRAIMVLFIHTIIIGYWWIIKNEQQQKQIQQQLIEQERALVKAELDNLHQQIQPHFLFNSLNSIGALTEINPKEANRMIHLLSDFLRGSLRKDIQTLVPLNEEVDQAKRYLEIEKIRFGHRLVTHFMLDENCSNAMVPPLIIQPVIENAIKFGLYGSLDHTEIFIECACVHEHLLITVKNPFDPTWVHERHGRGFGLTSIRRRLSLLFNQHDLLKTEQDGSIFITQIRIPQ